MARLRLLGVSGNLGALVHGPKIDEALAGLDTAPLDYGIVPRAVYCQPQVASVGLTEAEAKEKELEVSCGKFPFAASGKAVATAETDGFVKIIADKNSGEIIGAHIIGSEATELIAELALGKSAELGVEDLHLAIHAHPTLSEAVMEAAADATGKATHI